jgi:hypothetical protein
LKTYIISFLKMLKIFKLNRKCNVSYLLLVIGVVESGVTKNLQKNEHSVIDKHTLYLWRLWKLLGKSSFHLQLSRLDTVCGHDAMYALSAVLRLPIRAYYPPQIKPEFASEPYSRKVCGRGVNLSESTSGRKSSLYWVSTRFFTMLAKSSKGWDFESIARFKAWISDSLRNHDCAAAYITWLEDWATQEEDKWKNYNFQEEEDEWWINTWWPFVRFSESDQLLLVTYNKVRNITFAIKHKYFQVNWHFYYVCIFPDMLQFVQLGWVF